MTTWWQCQADDDAIDKRVWGKKPKRCRMMSLGLQYVFFCFVFITLTPWQHTQHDHTMTMTTTCRWEGMRKQAQEMSYDISWATVCFLFCFLTIIILIPFLGTIQSILLAPRCTQHDNTTTMLGGWDSMRKQAQETSMTSDMSLGQWYVFFRFVFLTLIPFYYHHRDDTPNKTTWWHDAWSSFSLVSYNYNDSMTSSSTMDNLK